MSGVRAFEEHAERYDDWFDRHEAAYLSELAALQSLRRQPGVDLEVGIGTGRFAEPLKVPFGIDPSFNMLQYAVKRGIRVGCAVGEALPFRDGTFDTVLLVTTICFVDDPEAVMREVRRVLKRDGKVIIGFIDRTSVLGRRYVTIKDETIFYKDARFSSADDIDGLLTTAGFGARTWAQTLIEPLSETMKVEPVHSGYGDGAFVVVRAGI